MKRSILLLAPVALGLVLLGRLAFGQVAAPAPAPAPGAGAPDAGGGDNAGGAGTGQDEVVVDDATKAMIDGALKWMAAQQEPGEPAIGSYAGSWSTRKGANEHRVAMTGYTLMSFMAAGQLPDEGEYGDVVKKGAHFLVNSIKTDGFIQAGATNMYGHGVATIALSEIYGETKDAEIKDGLQKAVSLIVHCQNQEGGWRYEPKMADADISVTVLQAVALRAAKNAGLDVPQPTLTRAVDYIHRCFVAGPGGFSYQPGGGPGFARTAAGIYSLQVLGQYDDPQVKKGVAYIWQHHDTGQDFYTYGNFYAAPAFYMVGGDDWKKWYAQLKDTLSNGGRKIVEGDMVHWNPIDGANGQGPQYSTAVYTLMLSMPYHYVPLYQR